MTPRRRHGPFAKALRERQTGAGRRRWLFVAYDQLSDRIGPLRSEDPRELGIVLVESPWKAAQRPYHQQKLALVLANLRHFALEQAARGVAVRHRVAHGPYREALAPLARELGPIRVMEPAERELRADLAPLVASGALQVVPHEGWLTTPEQFRDSAGPKPPWRMDAFYRRARRDSGILMKDDKPVGGKLSFDVENRRPWKGEPPAPRPPRFRPDAVTAEVADLVASAFGDHPGRVDPATLPATRQDALRLWRWARKECLPHFGPFEDAMSTRSCGLFHTRIAPLLNLHRLLPATVVQDVLDMELPLASKEGFVRQVLGWREFVRHVHRETDGFRRVPGRSARDEEAARPSLLGARSPLPPAWWGRPSGLACLDRAVTDVWREAWSHHIVRLMVLANLATLLDVAPRELADWFWVAYADAYDWVVEPNVLGMGTFALGDLMTTKPYVCGAAYLDRMSDYCQGCAFDPRADCPVTSLYWAFLERKQGKLGGNPRLAMPLRSLAKRAPERRRHDQAVYRLVRRKLGQGEALAPTDLT